MNESASDFVRLAELQGEIERIISEKEGLEQEWVELMEALEG
jgi:predicted  nucleic acid-binding Zn-ribbon protein